MRIVLIIVALFVGAHSSIWDLVIGLNDLVSKYREPYPAKPDPLFPAVKLFVLSPLNILSRYAEDKPEFFDKIDPENLNEYTSKLNTYSTVLYVYGFLDKTAAVLDSSGRTAGATTTSLFTFAYFLRNFIAVFSEIAGLMPPDSLYTNFIVLEWSTYNNDYITSLKSMPQIANIIGDKLYEMSQDPSNRLNLDNWQFIGFSLGAHIVGMIASRIKMRAGRILIPRVTGLDPAGPIIEFPLFRDVYPRLTKDCGNVS